MKQLVMETARTETGYSCSCDALPGWVVAGSPDFDTFKKEVQESIDFYVECARKDGDSLPEELQGEYEVVYKFNVQAFLEYYKGILSFSALETLTGINQKQLAHYAAGRSKPRRQQADRISQALHQFARELLTVTV